MGDLFLFEAGCIDLDNWCRKMEVLLTRHLNNPGRLNMSVADSSYDTWLDGYRPGVPGRKGSIYVEGAVLAFLCDCRIMKVSAHKKSLSTAMTLLWERFGMSRKGLTADEYWNVLAEVAGERLDDLREAYAYGVKDSWNDLVEAMTFNGLKLERSSDDKGVVRPKISKL
jgi:predicted metalloprotease with PDZ domain